MHTHAHTHAITLSCFSFFSSYSSSHPLSKLQLYISGPLMQLCHLDCLDVEAGWGGGRKKKNRKKNNNTHTTAHKACLLCIKKIKAWNCLRPALCLSYSLPSPPSWTQTHSPASSQSHTQTRTGRQLGFPETGQDKSRQFPLSITR